MEEHTMKTTILRQAIRGMLTIAVVLPPWHLVTLSAAEAVRPEYNRDVRPILSENCFACHGPDSAARQADLRLDKREVAVEKGAITPGDPEGSEMIRRIRSEDESERMPPPETKKRLTDAQKQSLARWIREGAKYQPHW